jgi:hypothetical protein
VVSEFDIQLNPHFRENEVTLENRFKLKDSGKRLLGLPPKALSEYHARRRGFR